MKFDNHQSSANSWNTTYQNDAQRSFDSARLDQSHVLVILSYHTLSSDDYMTYMNQVAHLVYMCPEL
jgi:hypothetical protein